MKCLWCENRLPRKRGWATETNSGKLACLLPGCPTFGLKPGSKRYQVEVMGRTEEEVANNWKRRGQKSVETKRAAGFFADKANNPYSREYWEKRGLTEEEINEKLTKKAQKGCETKREKGYFTDKANNPYSVEFWRRRGFTLEEAEKKIRSKNHNCPEYWIKRGYSIEEAGKKASESAATNSLEGKIARYGEEGHARFLRTRQLMSGSWNPLSAQGHHFSSSRQADCLFLRLYRFLRRLGYKRDDIWFKLNRGELYLHTGKQIYFYDFFVKPLGIIIEFNGEHVHPRRDLLTNEEWLAWKHAYSKKTADEVAAYDAEKLEHARKIGYNVLVIWSKDPTQFDTSINFLLKAHHEREDH